MEINNWLFGFMVIVMVISLLLVYLLNDYINAYDSLVDGYNILVTKYNNYKCQKCEQYPVRENIQA